MTRCSSFSAVSTAGTLPAFSYSTPLWTRRVASPPSSRIMFGPPVGLSGHVSACSVHHQYSSSVSPFQANTGTPCGLSGVPFGPTAMAAAAWSWVEKMLQEAQRTCAPRATRVSMSTAVCTVMCREPVTRAPARGWASAYSLRIAIRPGISCSARVISLRPNSARERSATLKSCRLSTVVIESCSSGLGRGGYGWSARRRTQGCPKEDTGMPACAQRSPSEALSPSAGPRWDRPTAISSDVWLRPKLHRGRLRSPVRRETHQADPVTGGGVGVGEVREWWKAAGPAEWFGGPRDRRSRRWWCQWSVGPPGLASGSGPLAASASL